jgi:hypothetical protein
MESVIISGDSIKDIHLLISIAEKMGLTIEHIVNEADSDEGEILELADTDKFLHTTH